MPRAVDTANVGLLHGLFPAQQYRFGLSLFDSAANRAPKRLRVLISCGDCGRPGPGSYRLGLMNPMDARGLYATYTSTRADTMFSYVSVRGELVITRSSPTAISGSFRFTAAEQLARWHPAGMRRYGSLSAVRADAPTIEIVGEFTAVPRDSITNERDL